MDNFLSYPHYPHSYTQPCLFIFKACTVFPHTPHLFCIQILAVDIWLQGIHKSYENGTGPLLIIMS